MGESSLWCRSSFLIPRRNPILQPTKSCRELSSESIRHEVVAGMGRGKIDSAVSDTSWPQEGSFPAW